MICVGRKGFHGAETGKGQTGSGGAANHGMMYRCFKKIKNHKNGCFTQLVVLMNLDGSAALYTLHLWGGGGEEEGFLNLSMQ